MSSPRPYSPRDGGRFMVMRGLLFLFCPFPALFDSCTLGVIAVLRVKGKIVQHLTGKIQTLSTIKESFILTANSYPTFTMKWMSFCGDATAASGFLSENTVDTAKTTSGINNVFLIKLFFHSNLFRISYLDIRYYYFTSTNFSAYTESLLLDGAL